MPYRRLSRRIREKRMMVKYVETIIWGVYAVLDDPYLTGWWLGLFGMWAYGLLDSITSPRDSKDDDRERLRTGLFVTIFWVVIVICGVISFW